MEQETNTSAQQSIPQPLVQQVQVLSARNRKIGLRLVIGPFVGIIVALIGIVISQVAATLLGVNSDVPSIAGIIMTLSRWFFGLIGILSVIGFPIGIPFGIIYLCKRELVDGVNYDERSGNKESSIVPEEIKGWNWGAAGLTWIWGISHGVWISLLVFIPLVNIIMIIILGLKGSEWAWKSQKWESVNAFNAYQRKWKPWGIAIFILIILGLVSNLFRIK